MPVTFRLEQNQRVIFWRFSHPWTLEDLVGHYKGVTAILDNSTQVIYSLVDVHGVRKVPTGLLKERYISMWDHPRHGEVLVIGANPLIRNIASVAFKKLHFERVIFFEDEPLARAYLDR